MAPTVYLNHAGTSWPKPAPVLAAVAAVHASDPMDWPAHFERDHHALAARIGLDPSRVLPTPGCTSALALALADLPWAEGDRLLVSSFEHEALMRPARALERRGVELVAVPPAGVRPLDLEALERELRGGARCVALSHASNVTGALLPIDTVIELAHAHDALVLVDCAQTTGWLPLPTDADMVAFAGHKGPQAPWGVGVLYVAPHVPMQTRAAVCSIDEGPPACAPMPGYCDAGSVDRASLAGLVAGLEWMASEPRLERARAILAPLQTSSVLGPPLDERVPTVALRTDQPPAELARALAAEGIVASGGLQCAPVAHETLGTPGGVLRLSVGPTTSVRDVERARAALDRLF